MKIRHANAKGQPSDGTGVSAQTGERLLLSGDAEGRAGARGKEQGEGRWTLGYRRFLGAKRTWEKDTKGSGDKTAEPLSPLAAGWTP